MRAPEVSKGVAGTHDGAANENLKGLVRAFAIMYSMPAMPSTLAISCGSHTAATVPWVSATRPNSAGASMLLSMWTWLSTRPGVMYRDCFLASGIISAIVPSRTWTEAGAIVPETTSTRLPVTVNGAVPRFPPMRYTYTFLQGETTMPSLSGTARGEKKGARPFPALPRLSDRRRSCGFSSR
ncbi:MAG: hypothetical protein BWX71_02169 [Deltaproteobacteria bacterium ADurb.Bin072]|nr:MAG: hypothetical protein BWX71_02169 [Deltaproteobacteria bacterium ADurb.Bin072]